LIRDLDDGDGTHFDGDSGRFTYLSCHTGLDIMNEGYAFHEGWADYWRNARWNQTALQLFNSPPATFADRVTPLTSACVQTGTVTPVAPWAPVASGGPPCTAATTDYCPAVAGPRGISLTDRYVDWVENMVADRLLFLANSCGGPTPDLADRTMLMALESNPGHIHSLFEFETALCASTPACCAFTRAAAPQRCPPGYRDNGIGSCNGPESHVIFYPTG
jgi:hypothetical protein